MNLSDVETNTCRRGCQPREKLLTNPQFDLSELADNQINRSDFGINTCTCGHGRLSWETCLSESVLMLWLKTTYELMIGLENGARFFSQSQSAAVEDKSNHRISGISILRLFSLQFARVVLSRFFPLLLGSVHLSACIVNYCFPLFFRALLRFHCISCDRPVDMIPGQ